MTRGYIIGALKRIDDAAETDRHVGQGASDDTFLKAEDALGLRFPPSYRAFLMAFGYGGAGCTYVYGVCDGFDLGEPAFPNLVGVNLEERKAGLPDHILLIEERDEGGHYALDFSTCDQSGETDVVVWPCGGHDGRRPLERVADDFGEFLSLRVAPSPSP